MPPKTSAKLTSRKAAKRDGGILETIRTLGSALLIALVIRTVAFEPFNIPSGSMIPTLLVGDFVFVSKYSYGYSRYSMPFSPDIIPTSTGRILASLPRRGDVVVFRNTRDTSEDWVKRVVGLPGDRIQVRNGVLFVNGADAKRESIGDYDAVDEHQTHILSREYRERLPRGRTHLILKQTDGGGLPEGAFDANNTPEYVVPENHLFMMGDNRDDSADSRFQNQLGFVPFENVVGRARFIFFSFDARAPWWEFWMWPLEVRWGRLFHIVK